MCILHAIACWYLIADLVGAQMQMKRYVSVVVGGVLAASYAVLAACGPNSPPAVSETSVEPVTDVAAPAEPALFDASTPFEQNGALLASWSNSALPTAITGAAPESSATIAYRPDCTSAACRAWSSYRSQRPFPLQTMAFARNGSTGTLIVTEPTISREKLEANLRDLFGDDVQLETHRWLIGVDGWLGDMVATIPAKAMPAAGDPLEDELFRDRLSLLAEDLWGTSFGLYLEDAKASWKQSANRAAPRLDVTPAELQSWLVEEKIEWRDPSGGVSKTFQTLVDEGRSGTVVTEAGDLVAFIITGEAIANGTIDRQRADFRRFSILSDAVVGGVWHESSGSLAILGRARQVPLEAMPPLRFETVAMLLAQQTNSLSQSYERNTPMAGKLISGPYVGRDWAPIYLSFDLVDTEYGALLNITDQMLKSWSMAGDVDYQYFDYALRPKPGQYVFGARPIATILSEETGGTSTLFNWNTSGAAAILSDGAWSAIAPTRSSSLPITYGSELNPGDGMRSGDLTRGYEEKAYSFYADLGDPNLTRVVAYATIYQAFRANPRAVAEPSDSLAPTTTTGRQTRGRAEAGRAYLAKVAAEALPAIDNAKPMDGMVDRAADALQVPTRALRRIIAEEMAAAREALATFRLENPRYASNAQIASLLVDRSTQQALADAFVRKVDEYNAEVLRTNARTFTSQYAVDMASQRLDAMSAELDREQAALEKLNASIVKLQGLVAPALAYVVDTESVRAGFVNAHSSPNVGWIRTPSIVLSWSNGVFDGVGGHNLNARALRIEVSDNLLSPALERGPNGPVLRVPPSSAAIARQNANQIARLVEHGGVVNEAQLSSMLASFKPAGPPRAPTTALKLSDRTPTAVQAGLQRGGTVRSVAEKVGTQHTSARANYGDATLYAIRQTDGRISMSFQRNGKMQCCVETDGFSQFSRYAKAEVESGGSVALVGFRPQQADSLDILISGGDRRAVSQALGGAGGGNGPPPNGVHFLSAGENPSGGAGGGGSRGSGGGRSGGSGGDVGGPGNGGGSQKLLIAGDLGQVGNAATRQRKLTDVAVVERGRADDVIREASLDIAPDSRVEVLELSFVRGSQLDPASQVYAFVELPPGGSPAGLSLAESAIRKAGETSPNVFSLATEAKKIVARNNNPGALRKLWIWVKESTGAFWLSEVEWPVVWRG